jgi:hypothetical protein
MAMCIISFSMRSSKKVIKLINRITIVSNKGISPLIAAKMKTLKRREKAPLILISPPSEIHFNYILSK